jgi:hypothetical protein
MSTDTLEQAVTNILTQRGFIRDSELKEQVNYIKPDFRASADRPLPEMFRSINEKLRKFSMEIKSIHLTNSNNERVTYHGLVNTEEDFVSKEYGSTFEAGELKFFTKIVEKLLEEKYLSSDDIADLRSHDRMRRDEATAFVAQLESQGWLRRNDSNYLILGVRAHLELRTYLEGVIMDSADLDSLEEDERAEKVAQLKAIIAEMPQIIVY